jgi:CO/xanthine dehydrogenase Mo-binding subunit
MRRRFIRRSSERAIAILDRDGTVIVRSATHEIGTGTYTAMTQFATDALGIPIEKFASSWATAVSEAPNNGGSWLTASVAPAYGAWKLKESGRSGGKLAQRRVQLANLFTRAGQEQVTL